MPFSRAKVWSLPNWVAAAVSINSLNIFRWVSTGSRLLNLIARLTALENNSLCIDPEHLMLANIPIIPPTSAVDTGACHTNLQAIGCKLHDER